MTEAIGVALIGTGMWGRRIALTLKETASLRLVTCFSRDETKRAAFADEFGCDAALSFNDAIRHPDVRAVLLVTPNTVHAEQAVTVAELGKHVFIEKPIADTQVDAQSIQEACEKAGVTLLVGHCFRRLGASRKVKHLLQEGALGQVVLAEANFSLPGALTPDKWRYHRDLCPGGPLMQLGIHHVDTLLYWLGRAHQVRGSFARLATMAEIDDVGVALMEFVSGARATVSSSYVSPRSFYLRLFGTEANLSYEVDMSVWGKSVDLDAVTTLSLTTNNGIQTITFEHHNMLVEELDEFAACIRGEQIPETSAAEGMNALRVIRGARC